MSDNKQERQIFEAWYAEKYNKHASFEQDEYGYQNPTLQNSWICFQAGRASLPVSQKEVGYIWKNLSDCGTIFQEIGFHAPTWVRTEDLTPVYASPVAPILPITDQQIAKIYAQETGFDMSESSADLLGYSRALLAAQNQQLNADHLAEPSETSTDTRLKADGDWYWVQKEDINREWKWHPAQRERNHWNSTNFMGIPLHEVRVGPAIVRGDFPPTDDPIHLAATVLRVQAALGMTTHGFVDPDKIIERLDKAICKTCNGHGLVGGMMAWGDGQVDSVAEPCPSCARDYVAAPTSDLPKLPKPAGTVHPNHDIEQDGYTEDQMKEYARAALQSGHASSNEEMAK